MGSDVGWGTKRVKGLL